MKSTPASVLIPTSCRVQFGCRATGVDSTDGVPVLQVALPVLAGASDERLLSETGEPVRNGLFTLFQSGSRLAGFAVAPSDSDLEKSAGELYSRLFAVSAGLHLYRIWNYVPAINGHALELENYKLFCRGRSLAFEDNFGRGFKRHLPAASAVGAAAGPLAIGFLAGKAEPQYCENPRQLPAFEYPPEYGPRPPSFSRAAAVKTELGRQIFISGTAAIRGHLTVAPHDLEAQLQCTLENLNLVGQAAGGSEGLGARAGRQRMFKIYVRHPADFPQVKSWLERELLMPEDTVSYLRANVCRSELLVEIEAVLTDSA